MPPKSIPYVFEVPENFDGRLHESRENVVNNAAAGIQKILDENKGEYLGRVEVKVHQYSGGTFSEETLGVALIIDVPETPEA
jgi:hypothetical protein